MRKRFNSEHVTSGPYSWTHRDVRKLLHLMRRPHALVNFPLAQTLAGRMGIASPYDAVVATIEETFRDRGLVGRRLRDMIWRCDVLCSATQAGAASDMGLSLRQFFRYRSEAVDALVNHINRARGDDPIEPIRALAHLFEDIDPVITLRLHELQEPRPSAASRFAARLQAGDAFAELAQGKDARVSLPDLAAAAMAKELHGDRSRSRALLEFIRAQRSHVDTQQRAEADFEASLVEFVAARHGGVPEQMRSTAERLAESAVSNEALRARSLLCDAEAHIHAGAPEAADAPLAMVEHLGWERKNIRELGLATLCRAEALFALAQAAQARTLATAANLTLRQLPYERIRCEGLLGRITLLLNDELATGSLNGAFTAHSWAELQLRAVKARTALAAGDRSSARELAAATTTFATQQGFESIRAWNDVTLSAIAFQEAAPALGQTYALQAWKTLAGNADHFWSLDAFSLDLPQRDLGPLEWDDDFECAVAAEIRHAFASVPIIANEQAFTGFLKAFRAMALEAFCGAQGDSNFSKDALRCAVLLVDIPDVDESMIAAQPALIGALCFMSSIPLPYASRATFESVLRANLTNFFNKVVSALRKAP